MSLLNHHSHIYSRWDFPPICETFQPAKSFNYPKINMLSNQIIR